MDSKQRTDMGVPTWTLGDRLRKVRRSAGYSARDFADLLGVTNSALSQYETDRARPRDLVQLAQRVQAVAGVPASWVLGLDDSTLLRESAQADAGPLFTNVPLPLFLAG